MLLENAMPVMYDKRGENIHRGENDCVGVLLIKSGELRTEVYIPARSGYHPLYRLGPDDVRILSAPVSWKILPLMCILMPKKIVVLLLKSSVFQQICAENIHAENFSYKSMIDRFSDRDVGDAADSLYEF